jgi:hypothetical protein
MNVCRLTLGFAPNATHLVLGRERVLDELQQPEVRLVADVFPNLMRELDQWSAGVALASDPSGIASSAATNQAHLKPYSFLRIHCDTQTPRVNRP